MIIDGWDSDVLMESGNWKIKRPVRIGRVARLWHIHKQEKEDYPTYIRGVMRCSMCHAKPPAALRGLVMIANWER